MSSSSEQWGDSPTDDSPQILLIDTLCALYEGHKRGELLRLVQLRAGMAPWLIYHGLVEHLEFDPKKPMAKPKPLQSAFPVPDSHLALTPKGVELAEKLQQNPDPPQSELPDQTALFAPKLLLPHYNKERRVFSWGRHILKDFHQPAQNQELILCAAEELNWPEFFDDPLPPVPGKNCKKRLHHTIQDLNRHQHPYFIHFKGDGTGTGIGWELR